jgi:hypothetical protein
MTVLSTALLAIALFLFLTGMACLGVLVKGCFVLRRLPRAGVNPARDSTILLKSPLVPPVSVIATPHTTTASTKFVRRLLDLQFGNHEVVVVVEDSATDFAVWQEEFHLVPTARAFGVPLPVSGEVRGVYESRDPIPLVVVDKKPSGAGPADALTAGLDAASSPVVAIIDESCDFDSELLLSLIHPILADPDGTVAVCGIRLPLSSQSGLSARYSELEALRVWLGRCAAFAEWKRIVPVPGAALLVRRDAVLKAGGFRGGPLELFLDLHGMSPSPGQIAFAPEAHSQPHSARSWADLRRHTATDQAMLARALGHRGPGGLWAIGWGLPGLLLVRWIRPLLETVAYVAALAGWILGWIEPGLAVLLLLCTVGVGILTSMAAVVLRELSTQQGSDPALLTRLFFAAIPENLGYRQLRNLWLISAFLNPRP